MSQTTVALEFHSPGMGALRYEGIPLPGGGIAVTALLAFGRAVNDPYAQALESVFSGAARLGSPLVLAPEVIEAMLALSAAE